MRELFKRLFLSLVLTLTALVFFQARAGNTAPVSPSNWDEWRAAYAENQAETVEVLSSLGDGSGTIGLEFILAGPSNSTGSGFGHALLRFVNGRGIPENDPVLALVADVSDQPTIDALKGFFGGYAVTVDGARLANVVRSYAIDQKRSLTRYIIPSTLQQRKNLLASYTAIFKQDKKFAQGYRFATKNCSSILQKLLLLSGITPMPMLAATPSLIPSALRESLLSPYPEITVVNPADLEAKLNCLAASSCDLSQFALKDLLQFAMLQSTSMNPKLLQPLIEEISRRRKIGQIERDPIPLKAAAPSLYQSLSSLNLDTEQFRRTWDMQTLKSNCLALEKQKWIIGMSPIYRGQIAAEFYLHVANRLCAASVN